MKKNRFYVAFRLSMPLLFGILLLAIPGKASSLSAGDSTKTLMDSSCTCHYFQHAVDFTPVCRFDEECPPLSELIKEWEAEIFPSPVRDNFSISVEGGMHPGFLRVRVVDLQRIVHLEIGEMQDRRVDVIGKTLVPGSYNAEFLIGNEVVMRRRFLVYRQ